MTSKKRKGTVNILVGHQAGPENVLKTALLVLLGRSFLNQGHKIGTYSIVM